MTVHLVIPGLLGPLAETDIRGELASFPTLKKCISRADKLPWKYDDQQTLFELLNIPWDKNNDLPTATISLLGETGDQPVGWWIHADPVILKADGDRLLLFDATELDCPAEQMQALATAFNDHFGCDGLHLQATVANRWYITATEPPDLHTASMTEVVGRNIDPWLPKGTAARQWCQIINETQMLFFNHPVNNAREALGQVPISGVWFSGGGQLPVAGDSNISKLFGDDPLLEGIAALTAMPLSALSDCQLHAEGDALILVTKLQRAVLNADVASWRKQLDTAEHLMFDLMKAGEPLMVYPDDDSVYHWKSSHQWRFWRSL